MLRARSLRPELRRSVRRGFPVPATPQPRREHPGSRAPSIPRGSRWLMRGSTLHGGAHTPLLYPLGIARIDLYKLVHLENFLDSLLSNL